MWREARMVMDAVITVNFIDLLLLFAVFLFAAFALGWIVGYQVGQRKAARVMRDWIKCLRKIADKAKAKMEE